MGEAIILRTLENNELEVVQETGISTSDVMSQKAVTDELNKKVDKVEGKGLSSEDFTAEEKEKLDNAVPTTAVVQGTGTSTTNIMSQKTVTDKLNEKMDISQEYIRRRQYVPLKSSADNIGWFLVLHGQNNLQYENYSCMLAVTQTFPATSNQSSGIIFFNIRVNDYNMFVADFRILCGNLLPDRFRLVINSYTDFYVYIKTTVGFEKYMFEVLSEGRQTGSTYLPTFEFNSSTTPISGDPGGAIPK